MILFNKEFAKYINIRNSYHFRLVFYFYICNFINIQVLTIDWVQLFLLERKYF